MRAFVWALLGFFGLALAWQWHRWWHHPRFYSENGLESAQRFVAHEKPAVEGLEGWSASVTEPNHPWRFYEIVTQPDGWGGLRIWSLKWKGDDSGDAMAFEGHDPDSWLERYRRVIGVRSWRRLDSESTADQKVYEAWDEAGRKYRLTWRIQGARLEELRLERWAP